MVMKVPCGASIVRGGATAAGLGRGARVRASWKRATLAEAGGASDSQWTSAQPMCEASRQVETGNDAAAQRALQRRLRPGALRVADRIGYDDCRVQRDAPPRPVEVQASDVQRVHAVGLAGDFAGGPVAQQAIDQR